MWKALLEKMDSEAPGGVYLCQIGETVSCGACCGLYNLAGYSRQALWPILKDRSIRFSETQRTADAIVNFGEAVLHALDGTPPHPDFHHCPYLGLMGEGFPRVGCLLHPLAAGNHGIDYRGISYYGGLACNGYFCPSHHQLPASYKRIVRAVIADGYFYGMIVTEADLIRSLFAAVERRIHRLLVPAEVANDRRAASAVLDLLSLKMTWPFRKTKRSLVHYFFNDREERSFAWPEAADRRINEGYDAVFRALDSEFPTRASVLEGCARLDGLIRAVETALE